ncbi:TPA: nitronate monooxygenase [Streptococcus suis]|nr:nitronate monooxygenase [Streptococcus suis]
MKTKITELLNIDYPIFQGGMAWVADGDLAGAVSNAGGLGIIGEGGSGGALALAVADQVWMLENSMYAVLSPEGFASILWKDGSRAMEAAELMKITSYELEKLQVVDRVVLENGRATKEVLSDIKENLVSQLAHLQALPLDQLLENRYQRFRKY